MAEDADKSREERAKELRARLDAASRTFSRRKRDRAFPADEVKRAVRRQKEPKKAAPAPESIVYYRDLPRRDAPSPESVAGPGGKVTLEEAVDGSEVHSGRGKAFVVSTRLDDLGGAESISGTFSETISSEGSSLCQRIVSACGSEELTPQDIIFVDVESTGLSNSPLFLIGTMVWERDGFEVRQYLARNYAEEAAIISFFIEACTSKKLLITFNGKSFDLPFIRTRAVVNGIPFDVEPAHFDLLHECRRIWKDALPDCRLKTLERHVCNRARYGDIPGDQIPEAYHAYVRTENAWQMVGILKHNMLDLVTLADLMIRFPEA